MSRAFILLIVLLFLITAHQAGAVPGADWPNVRHDPRLTGQSPLKGGLAHAPKELWSIDLGGPTVPSEGMRLEDVNGDGRTEVVRILKDRLVCQDLAAGKLWEVRNLPDVIVRDIRDYAGDGGRGLLITYTDGLNVVYAMVDGRSGKKAALFSARNVFGGTNRTGRILPGVRGQQYCFWWSGGNEEAWAYLWSFEKGPARPTLRFQTYDKAMIYAPLHAFADMDGDGENEMVMLSHEQIWAYSIKTSKLKFHTTWRTEAGRIRSYQSITGIVPLKPGELPSILSMNQNMPGAQVIKQDGKGRSRVLWKKLVWRMEYQYQNEVKITSGAPNPFMDIDGDGVIEIMAAVTNEHGDGQGRLVIWNADNGDRLFDEAGISVQGVEDLDGDGKPEVIVKRGDTLSITDWTGKAFVDRRQSKGAEPLFRPLEPEGDLKLMSQGGGLGNRTLWREKPESSLFLMRIDGKVWSCRLVPGGALEQVNAVERHEALGNVQDPPKPTHSWDGNVLKTTVDGQEVVGYKTPYHRMYLAPPAIASSVDGQMRVLARNADGALLSISADGSTTARIAEHVSTDSSCRITDLDGDGRNDIVVSNSDSDGRPAVQVLDGSGKVTRTFHPAAPGGSFVLGPTGSLGPGNGQWFAALVRNPYTIPTVVAYNGKTGEELWRRPGYGLYDNEPSQFVLHIPTAVWDYDRDGADDLICLSENFYGIIDVAHNKDLVDPMSKTMLSNMIPGHWTAYATPSLMADPASGKPRIALSRSYAMGMLVIDIDGWPVWHYGVERDETQRNLVGLGDLDGDGKTELVSARQDGLLTAFDWDALDRKCPRCPKDEPLSKLNHGGKVRWTFKLPPPVSDFASADLDGDGKTELLCGCGDGRLYALKESKGKCGALWSVDLGRTVGSPVIADVNGDGSPEVLAASEDGRLHCLSSSD